MYLRVIALLEITFQFDIKRLFFFLFRQISLVMIDL